MSAVGEPPAFGSLYYTDCLPGQGLSGGAGFQFQARSGSLADDAHRAVQRGVLYEVPTRWLRDQRPVEDYPQSLAHVHDDGFIVTAAGRYLGKEAKGYRDGNQFTHALVTLDPSSYGSLRPAQLWGAPWWADEPAPTTSCPEVPALPSPGPWDTEAVRDHVRAAPRGEERLVALVSALAGLRGPDRRRVLVVTADPAEAACWVAAGTLLLDRERALRVSFKFFCTDPDRTPHDVLAVHPDWSGSYERSGDYVVLDLRGSAVPTAAITAEAAFWVPRFLDEDPLDVVDAAELAGQLARELSLDTPGEVERTVAALALGIEGVGDSRNARAVATWLSTAPVGAVELLGAPLAESLAATTDHTALVALDTMTAERAVSADARDRGWVAVAVGVRRRLFEHELGAAHAARGVAVTGRVRRLDHALDPSAAVTALDTLSGPEPAAAMQLAHRYDLTPTGTMVGRFVSWWVDHTDSTVDVLSWPYSDRVQDALCRELDGRLARDRQLVADQVRRHWWERPWPLWRGIPVLGPDGPQWGLHQIDVAIARAAYVHGGESRRTALTALAEVIGTRAPSGDPRVGAWDLVLGTEPVSNSDVRRFLTATPASEITRKLAFAAYRSLRAARTFDADAAEALAVLEKQGLGPEELGYKDYPPSDPAIAEVVELLRGGARPRDVERLRATLKGASRPTRADRSRLLTAVLEAPALVAGPLLQGRSNLRGQIVENVGLRARGDDRYPAEPEALALAVVIDLLTEKPAEEKLGRVLARWRKPLHRLGPSGRDAAFRHLLRERDGSPYSDLLRLWSIWQHQIEGLELPGKPANVRRDGDRPASPPPAAAPSRHRDEDRQPPSLSSTAESAPTRLGRFLRKKG